MRMMTGILGKNDLTADIDRGLHYVFKQTIKIQCQELKRGIVSHFCVIEICIYHYSRPFFQED